MKVRTRLKVCGLRPGDDLGFTGHPLVSYVGFVFVPGSRRCVDAQAVRPMVQSLPHGCSAIGVFVGAELDEILRVCDVSGITGVQLHGRETPELCRQLRARGLTVWKAWPLPRQLSTEGTEVEMLAARIQPYLGSVDGFLFDAAPPQGAGTVTGGHGQTFDWRLLPKLAEWLKTQEDHPQVWAAGGIRPENVADCLAHFVPDGLDVSSGVEVDGRKSPERIMQLIDAVAGACDALSEAPDSEQAVKTR
jgi:phosphoribosylanthranilate isomerase